MKLFYDTMDSPEIIEFYVESQGRKMIKEIRLPAFMRTDRHVIRMLKNRLSVEGDRLSDVTGFSFHSKQARSTVKMVFDLSIQKETAERELDYRMFEARRMIREEGMKGSESDV